MLLSSAMRRAVSCAKYSALAGGGAYTDMARLAGHRRLQCNRPTWGTGGARPGEVGVRGGAGRWAAGDETTGRCERRSAGPGCGGLRRRSKGDGQFTPGALAVEDATVSEAMQASSLCCACVPARQ
eukprot:366546-Chlamydomonas_euryale.AAC.33